MALARLSLLLAFSALTTWAMAGDKPSSPQATSSNADVAPQSSAPRLGGAASVPPNRDVVPPGAAPDLALAPDAQDRRPLARVGTPRGVSLADGSSDVCYTLRTYKVKPTERIRDHENSFRGYSECEMASTFQIRSAEAHPKKPQPSESPATLK